MKIEYLVIGGMLLLFWEIWQTNQTVPTAQLQPSTSIPPTGGNNAASLFPVSTFMPVSQTSSGLLSGIQADVIPLFNGSTNAQNAQNIYGGDFGL